MLKLSRNGIGLLTAQYRSVLRKCLLLNICAAGIFAFSTPSEATVYDSAVSPRFQYMGMSVYADDTAYVYGSAGYNIKEVMNDDDGSASDTHNDAWVRNKGKVYFGYNTSGSQLDSTVVSHKHNITVLNGYAISGGGAIANMNNDTSNTELNIYRTEFYDDSATRFLNEFGLKDTEGVAAGGALSNYSANQAEIVTSSFEKNYVMHFNQAAGGAIYNGSNALFGTDVVLGSIRSTGGSTFVNNHAGNELMEYYTYIEGEPSQVESKILDVWKNNSSDTTNGDLSLLATGGAIHNEGSYISNNDRFEYNHAIGTTSKGGAIFNDKNSQYPELGDFGGEVNLDGIVTFVNNYAGQGKTATGATVYGTTAYGGAIYNDGDLNIATGSDTSMVYFGNDESTLGSAGNYAVATSTAAGGAIYNDTDGVINAIRYNSIFKENYAQGIGTGNALGGAIANFGQITLQGGTFTNNTSYSDNGSALGGAIYNKGTISGTVATEHTLLFNGNYAEEGGAVYNEGTYTSNNNTFVSNIAFDSTTSKGGALLNAQNATTNLSGNIVFKGNSAGEDVDGTSVGSIAQGGAIYNNGTFNINSTSSDTIYFGNEQTVAGSLGNHVTATTTATGGAIYNDTSGVINAIRANSIFQNNYAQGIGNGNALGGAITNLGQVTLQGGSFTSNRTTSSNGYAHGGAIYNEGTISGTVATGNTLLYDGNSAEEGGAVYNKGTYTSNNNSFTSNTALDTNTAKGGALLNAQNATTNLSGNLSFTGNSATATSTAQGGAIYNNSALNINSTSGNTIYFGNDQSVIGSLGNYVVASTTASGGAIYNDTHGVISSILANAVFQNNYAQGNSSGNAKGGAVANLGQITLQGGTFTNNYASSANGSAQGGAVYNKGTVSGTVAAGNTLLYSANSAKEGGAVYNEGSYTSNNNTFASNTVFDANTSKGGALFNAQNATTDLSGNIIFTGNSAGKNGSSIGATAQGGAIYNDSSLNITSANTLYFGNDTTVSGSQGNYVTASSNASGGAIYNDTHGVISSILANAVFQNNYAQGTSSGNAKGGAVANLGQITLQGGTFTNNYASSANGSAQGGAVYNKGTVSGTVAAGNTLLYSANSAKEGGAVYNEGSYTSNNNTFASNTVFDANTSKGGALFNAQNATIDLSGNIIFTGNSAGKNGSSIGATAQGGAIYNDSSLNITSANTLYFGNDTTVSGSQGNYVTASSNASGGAIYNDTHGVISSILANAVFQNNYAQGTSSGNAKGGAVANLGQITLQGGTFTNNYASSANGSAQGGAVYNDTSGVISSILANAVFQNNYAQGTSSGNAKGGAVANLGQITLQGGTFTNNYASSANGSAQGGAFYNKGTVSGTVAAGNTLLYSANSAKEGGAVYNEGTYTSNNNTFASNTVFDANTSKGGALFNAQNATTDLSGNIIFTGNSAGKNGSSIGATAQGGAIYNDSSLNITSANTLYFGNDTTVSGSLGNGVTATSNASGGAIYNDTHGVISSILANAVFQNNYAQGNSSGNAKGGAVANLGQITLQGGTFTNNYASSANGSAQGGAVYNKGTVSGTVAAGNTLLYSANSAKEGGAVYNEGSYTSNNNTFASNTVFDANTSKGGALFNAQNATTDLSGNIIFTGNSAGKNGSSIGATAQGGAIYNDSSLNITSANTLYFGNDTTVSGSLGNGVTATSNASGGAIYNDTHGVISSILANAVFQNNYAQGNSSGNAKGGAVANLGQITLQGGTFTNNYASSANGSAQGGAVYNKGTVSGTVAAGNTLLYSANSAKEGGAVYNEGSYTSNNNTFASNTVFDANTSKGGALFNAQNATTDLSGNIIFTGNSAGKNGSSIGATAQGGAIYNDSSLNITSANTLYFGNDTTVSGSLGNGVTATSNASGGAIYNDTDGVISSILANAVFQNNYAQGIGTGNALGGAIANLGQITLQGGTFTNNYAASSNGSALGGAIYNGPSDGTKGKISLNIAQNTIYKGNTAGYGGAFYNAGIINGLITNATLEFTGNSASVTSGGIAMGNSIYNAGGASVDIKLTNGAKIHFAENQSVYNAGSKFKITGNNDDPNELSVLNVSIMSGDNTSVLLDTTLYSASSSAAYDISNTNLILSSTGFIDSTAINSSALNDTALNLSNNKISLQSGSYMNLNSGNDSLNNNDFTVSNGAYLRYKNQSEDTLYRTNTIINNGTVTYYGYADDSDMYVAKALVNANTLNTAADGLLTNVHIDNLKSKEGSQIVVNLNNPLTNTSTSKADVIVIDSTIHSDAGTTTQIVFHDLTNNYIDQVYLGVKDKIYFAQTQVSQIDYDFENTFSTTAVNDKYEIKIGYEVNGAVYDWFLYRDPEFGPEDIALIDLPRAALEQTRSILSPISRTNRDLCSCYQDDCDNGFCRCENTGAMRRLWATPFYKDGSYDYPVETDFTINGVDFGLDYQPTRYDMYGIFGSYRNGTYENDGKGKKYFSEFGSKLDITSLIGGIYYRRYFGNFYMLSAAYGGTLDVDLTTDTDVKASIDGYTVGAQVEMGYNARLTRREVLTPSLRATYNFIKFKDANDVNDKKASIDAVNNVELEAALKYEYQFNNEYQLPTTGYIKPSVIQTIASGGTVKIDDEKYEDTLKNETLGRVEIGADAEIIRNFSIGAFGNYTFGSEYKAWGVGGNIKYVW